MAEGRKVLIVDDEPLVAMLLGDYLDVLGHEVVDTAESLGDALEAVDSGGFDLAVLDCTLRSGVKSWPVAERLAERGVPFLFSSGASRDELPERFADRPMLAKPYTMAALQASLSTIGG